MLSVLTIISIVVLIVLHNTAEQYMGCREEQGPGAIIILGLEIPLIILTIYFSRKFKKLLNLQSSDHRTDYNPSPTVLTKHLIEQEDKYITLKKLQANLTIFALLVNFTLHLLEMILYFGIDKK